MRGFRESVANTMTLQLECLVLCLAVGDWARIERG